MRVGTDLAFSLRRAMPSTALPRREALPTPTAAIPTAIAETRALRPVVLSAVVAGFYCGFGCCRGGCGITVCCGEYGMEMARMAMTASRMMATSLTFSVLRS